MCHKEPKRGSVKEKSFVELTDREKLTRSIERTDKLTNLFVKIGKIFVPVVVLLGLIAIILALFGIGF